MSDIAGGLIGAGGSLLNSLVNNMFAQEANRVQMSREDTAVQRRVADLKAAGLSPTLAAGSAASSAPIRAMSMQDPIAAGSAMMQQQGSVGVSAAEKERIKAIARQESIKADAMESVVDLWQRDASVVHVGPGAEERSKYQFQFSPYIQREFDSILRGSKETSQAASAASEMATSAEAARLDLNAYKALGGSSVVGGALLKILQGVLSGGAMIGASAMHRR